MISYAQNFEDVMLYRALKGIVDGFYVDVGANDPVVDSVTKPFYDSGWHGINIEPIKRHWEDLIRDRTRDINLNVAAGRKQGVADIFEPDLRGLATLDRSIAEKIENEGIAGTRYQIEVRTLKDIFNEYKIDTIHFLKIDVEGFEKEVLEGADFNEYRPWILVLEATRPSSQESNFSDWEPIVLEADYEFVYFDGLNRFYLAKEHRDLAKYFSYPPCVFDGFVLHSQKLIESDLINAEAKAQQAEAKAQQAEAKAWSILESRSWKITAPLRALGRWARRLKRAVKILLTDPRLFVKKIVVKLLRKVGKIGIIKKILLLILRPFPQFKAWLKTMVHGPSVGGPRNSFGAYTTSDLSPRAQQIYRDLKNAIKQKQKQGK